MIVAWDIETDSLNPSVVWCLCLEDIVTGKQYSFIRPDLDSTKFREVAKNVELWVGHNVVKFDIPVIERLIGNDIIPRSRVLDTLILSRLDKHEREGGHSLENWGVILGSCKKDYKDFSRFTFEMLSYCKQDVSLSALVYKYLLQRLAGMEFRKAIVIEHATEFHLSDMEHNGFSFDIEKALEIQTRIEEVLKKLDISIQSAFPPVPSRTPEQTVRVTKEGCVSRVGLSWYERSISDFYPGSSFCRLIWEEFNPGSSKQIVERLHDAGWSPTEKTKTHIDVEKLRPRTKQESAERKERLKHFKKYGWKINERNLSTLPEDAPEGAKALVEHMLYASRGRTLTEWLENVREDGKIHGQCTGLGTWTQRATHRAPNTANIAAEKSLKYTSPKLQELAKQYGREMRSLWRASDGRLLVGTDAEGIQLRILGHYLRDQGYIDAIVNGDKDKGTDVHSVNKKTLGDVCRTRDTAKTFIYALLLGAGIGKIGDILNCSYDVADDARERFIRNTPGLKELKDIIIPRDARRGFFYGVDGRRVYCDSEHLMLAGYLQNGEALVMKYAMDRWIKELRKLGIPFWLVNWIHDEWQTEVENDREIADTVGRIQCEAITWAGTELGIVCPLAGKSSSGINWYETH